MKNLSTPIGTHDAFRDVTAWNDETAQMWTNALNLRAESEDQRNLRARLVESAKLQKGATAIEIGCGTGALLCDLAQVVGLSGHVIGVEPQKAFAEAAARKLSDEGFASIFDIKTESADRLSIDDEIADACLAQTVLIHLPEAVLQRTLNEMVRFVRRGSGRVVSADQDGDTWTIDHPDRDLTRRIIQFNSDQRYADGWTGRRLRRLFLAAGLKDVEIQTLVHTDTDEASYLFGMAKRIANPALEIGELSQNEYEKWIGELNETASQGNFFSSINYYICSGVRV